MNIISTQYNLPLKTFEIYLSGCKGKYFNNSKTRQHCNGCHNAESWNFKSGQDWQSHYQDKIKPTLSLSKQSNLLKNIWILGGEPLDQDPRELYTLLNNLKQNYPDTKLWLWTGYSLEWVLSSPQYKEVLKFIDYIKVGHFDIDNKSSHYIQQFDITLQSDQELFEVINESFLEQIL